MSLKILLLNKVIKCICRSLVLYVQEWILLDKNRKMLFHFRDRN